MAMFLECLVHACMHACNDPDVHAGRPCILHHVHCFSNKSSTCITDRPLTKVLPSAMEPVLPDKAQYSPLKLYCRYCSDRCRRNRSQTPQAVPSATMAPAAPADTKLSAKAGKSPEANQSLRCQDLGNIVHLEHLNLEVIH